MRVEIRIDRGGSRRWHGHLAVKLAATSPDCEVRLVADEVTAPAAATAGPVAALLTLERMVLRRWRETWMDRPEPGRADAGFTAEAAPAGDVVADVVIDCRTAEPGRDGAAERTPLVLRPLFDGVAGEDALVALLLARRMPRIEIEAVGTGTVLAAGQPSGESADGLTGGLEAVLSRVVTLLQQVVTRAGEATTSPATAIPAEPRPARPATVAEVVTYALRNAVMNAVRAAYHLCLWSPHWRIGWRFIEGPGVMERGDLGGTPWRVLPDPGHRFFADPFPVTWNGRTFVFFEDLDHRRGKGIISAIEFGAEGPRGPVMAVLEEPWHMSYPFMIEADGALWMVPESSVSGAVPLYRCIEFPHRWERVGSLIEGIEAGDCTILRHAGRLWMMSATREGIGGYSDILRIHHATDLRGPWTEHRMRPVLVDVAAARPAGAVVARNGKLFRPIQDCTQGYGRAMSIARIDRLDEETFEQTVVARLRPGPLWPGPRLHTLNRLGRLECIDGTCYNPRLGVLRGFAAARQAPAGDRLFETGEQLPGTIG